VFCSSEQIGKNLVLTVQSVRSDVAGPYRPYDDMSDGDMVDVGWLTVGESGDDTCPLVANGVRTRGPIRGRHVSLIVWFILLCKIYGGVRGVQPPNLPQRITPSHDRPTIGPRVGSCYMYMFEYI
jgi:hypothetical protein